MASDNNMVLNIPFDEPEGSQIAYDYSQNRADGTVVESNFVSGRQGNCIEFNGEGYCQIPQNIIPITGNFTLLVWLMRGDFSENYIGKKIGFWFAWNDVNGFRETWINITSAWNFIAITKEGLIVRIYLNEQLIETITLPVQPTGFGILQDIYFTEYGYGLIDEVKAYNIALSQSEISEQLNSVNQLSYFIEGINFKDLGITVSESNGVLDRPKLKSPFKVDWPDYHGEVIDLTRKRVEAREIELKCWMKAAGKMDFVTKLNSFLAIFQADGTQRLTVDIHPTKPLIFEVYNESGISISKRWNDEVMIGTFTLKLKEPDPVKRVVRHQRISEDTKTLTITMTTAKAVTIHWGDGTKDYDVYGENITRSHNYTTDGIFYAVIGGVIEDITNFSTNGILVWNKL
ncbi:MAG: hypothetical protein EZS26_000725 [Candidatus Ordinivivax streblomastigis]|uniref:LamG domain-containing protein n=1 Tax=Candidatus Ordinivivax streblomastigis TaxID=2540710 RepID=A0A5M8P469_9BACT|nr:MAG: hypothetical protein EZS26_000725 [Candidatus Ordinivivax streblomastigis]